MKMVEGNMQKENLGGPPAFLPPPSRRGSTHLVWKHEDGEIKGMVGGVCSAHER
jgi:hypothetical protein